VEGESHADQISLDTWTWIWASTRKGTGLQRTITTEEVNSHTPPITDDTEPVEHITATATAFMSICRTLVAFRPQSAQDRHVVSTLTSI